ncbi:hypothetical protein JCM10212_003455 [Sporobolomyces blumeae]
MPPYRDPHRLFYDPVSPVMLSQAELSQLSPQELQAATDQLDQHLILVLQKIEENFAKCNQVVVEALLPAVEQHGENSAKIYESIKFWRPFFEAAASIRLNEPFGPDDTGSVANEDQTHASGSPDRTVSSVGDETYSRESAGSGVDVDGTPRATRTGQGPHSHDDDFASPERGPVDGRPANSAMKQPPKSSTALPELQRLRLRDLPPDSPDVPEPQFETAVFGGFGRGAAGQGRGGAGDDKGKGHSFDLSSDPSSPSYSLLRGDPSPAPSNASERDASRLYRRGDEYALVEQNVTRNVRPGGGDKAHSKLLDKILRKNLDSPVRTRTGPGSSTPGRPSQRSSGTQAGGGSEYEFPPEASREWNGIANLSETALDAFASPIKRRQSAFTEDSFANLAPPSTARRPEYLTSSPAPGGGRPLDRSTASSATDPAGALEPLARSHGGSKPFNPSSTSFASPSKLSRTPAKYAARLTAQNVYDSLGLGFVDSPILSPPSILRTNTKPFNLQEHTARQDAARGLGRTGARGDDEGEDDGAYEPASPSERSRIAGGTSRSFAPSRHGNSSFANAASEQGPRGGGGGGTGRGGVEEESFASSLPAQPSFINHSQSDERTRPFNLYEYTHRHESARPVEQGPFDPNGSREGDGGDFRFDGDERGGGGMTDNIDDLLAGHTMTYHAEQRLRASLAPGAGLEDIGGGEGGRGRGQGLDDLGGIVDDDEGQIGSRVYGQEDDGTDGYDRERRGRADESYTDEQRDPRDSDQGRRGEGGAGQGHGATYGEYDDDDSFAFEREGLRAGHGADAGGRGGRGKGGLLDGPEDTLFGMPPTASAGGAAAPVAPTGRPNHHHLGYSLGPGRGGTTAIGRDGPDGEEGDSFTDSHDGDYDDGFGGRGQAGAFRLHGLSDMETLHGGELLSSEPFQASPLAGKWTNPGAE